MLLPETAAGNRGPTLRRSEAAMGTIVTVDVPQHASRPDAAELDALVDRAFRWFRELESTCSRFDPASELQQLSHHIGTAVSVSPFLFEAVRFALTVAEETDGAFDPTVGRHMETLGFNHNHRTHQVVTTPLEVDPAADWRRVHLDESNRTITLECPLLLDLGGVAKGLALDLASRDLASLGHFVIDAGGDLYLGGSAAEGTPWSVGIRHPNRDDVLLDRLQIRDRAVCTSGLYERTSTSHPDARHIIDPRDGSFPKDLVSATVVASSALLADTLATTVLVLGAERGRTLLDNHRVCGLMFTGAEERITTKGCRDDVLASA